MARAPSETSSPFVPKGRGANRFRRVRQAVRAHEQFRGRALNLQASENLLSPAARQALGGDMASRYSLRLDREFDGVFLHHAYGGGRLVGKREGEKKGAPQEGLRGQQPPPQP